MPLLRAMATEQITKAKFANEKLQLDLHKTLDKSMNIFYSEQQQQHKLRKKEGNI